MAGFSEAGVCDRLQVSSLEGLDWLPAGGRGDAPTADLLDLLIDLFVVPQPVTSTRFTSVIADAWGAALLATDLVRLDHARAGCVAPVRLVPAAHGDATLLIASDAPPPHDIRGGRPAPDVVFSAHNPLTRQFLRLAPHAGAGFASLLDLGTGTGVAAVAAAPGVPRVVAVDIEARAVHFARFNAWLNDRPIDVRQGDLYAPAAGMTFDCVLAHPPYVPTLTPRAVYRDGGETGEVITRRVVEGLPDHLNDAGVLLMPCIAMDTADGEFETRVRQWLGPAAAEFDLIFAVADMTTAADFARALARRVSDPLPDEEAQWRQRFAAWGVERVVYGVLAARRFGTAGGSAQTRRVRLADNTGFEAFEWLFAYFDRVRGPNFAAEALGLAPRIAATTRLRITYGMEEAEFVPTEFLLENGGAPFPAALQIDAPLARLVTSCDGHTPAALLFNLQAGRGSDIALEDFIDRLAGLAERGILDW